MVREGHEQGTILASEAELIHNVFEFDDKEVKDIMTHRKNIVSLDGSMSFIDAIEFIIDTGKSRFPVYENDVDSIIGVLHIKDAFTFFEKMRLPQQYQGHRRAYQAGGLHTRDGKHQ